MSCEKTVLISIRPEWVEKITSGVKTIEVRKKRPKLQPPFKCYIYQTGGSGVIGEFTCDKIYTLCQIGFNGGWGKPHLAAMKPEDIYEVMKDFDFSASCLSVEEIEKYLDGKEGYAWHISALKVYEKPLKIGDFKPWHRECKYSDLGLAIPECSQCHACKVEKAPQSWCYVEEITYG